MSRLKIITKYFVKNAIDDMFGNSKFGTGLLLTFMVFIVTLLSLPFSIMIGSQYEYFHSIGQEGALIATILVSGSTVTFLFGIYTIMNIFYFSNDIDEILPLPFKSSHIVFGKFMAVIINIYIYNGLILLPLIVYGVTSKSNVIYYIYSIIIFLLTPILPMVLAGILCMILMRFTNLSKHKDAFRMITGCLSLILVVAFNFFTNGSNRQLGSEEILSMIAIGNDSLINNITGIFITNKFASYGLVYNSALKGLLYIILFIVINLLLFLVYYFLGGKLYLKGIIGMSESYSKRENIIKNGKASRLIRKNSPLKALAVRDVKVILRTPQFFINCVAMLFYMPAIMGVALLSGGQLEVFRNLLNNTTEFYSMAIVVSFISGSLCVLGGGAGMTALSREGKDFIVSKYIPVDYKTQLHSKILSSLWINEIGAFIVLIILIIIGVKPLLLVLGTITAFGSIALITLFGLYIDFRSPRLEWENEKAMFKNNYMALLNMLILFFLGVILVILAMIIKNYLIIFSISLAIAAGGSIILYKVLISLAYKIYNRD